MKRSLILFLAGLMLIGCGEHRVAGVGSGPQQIPVRASEPSPEAMEAWATEHPPCEVSVAPSTAWNEVRLSATSVAVRLPPDYQAAPDFPSTEDLQTWLASDSTSLTLVVLQGGQVAVGGDDPTVESLDQGVCSLQIAERLSSVLLGLLISGPSRDTVHFATANVAVRPEFWIGAAILSPSTDGRDQALAVLRTARLVEAP